MIEMCGLCWVWYHILESFREERVFEIYVKSPEFFMIFGLLQCCPLRAPWTLKTIYMLKFDNFLSTRPILDLNLSFDKVRRDLNICLRGSP